MAFLGLILFFLVLLIVYKNLQKLVKIPGHLKSYRSYLKLAMAVIVFLAILKCFVVIDAGEVGVQILFGRVQQRTLKAGINIINPLVEIIKYPTRIQDYTMSFTDAEGRARGDDSITTRTVDGLEVSIDLTIWWYVDPENVNNIYEQIARSMPELEYKITRPSIRAVVRDVTARYNMHDLYSENRTEYSELIQKELSKVLNPKFLVIDKVLVRKIKLPEIVESAIQNKMKAKQEEEAMEYKKI